VHNEVPVVNSWNEWDPLEEVIIGYAEGAFLPQGPPLNNRDYSDIEDNFVQLLTFNLQKSRYRLETIQAASAQLGELCRVLKAEGVNVRRPQPVDLSIPYSTPHWSVQAGFNLTNPRDLMLVIGNEIIETPSCSRDRYFETFGYRKLLKEYFQGGAKWTAAPRPVLDDRIFDLDFKAPKEGEQVRYFTTEHEPIFDAADFVRCGYDIFCQRSNATNLFGIEWLRRHLGSKFRVHEIISHCPYPWHIDTTFLPIAPGKAIYNPDWVKVSELPPILKKWDLLPAERSQMDPAWFGPYDVPLTSSWICMNVLSIDEKRLFIEKQQTRFIAKLKDWGFEPIPLPIEQVTFLGGGFHCASLDVRRRGGPQNYF
jgi:glycine amidinotransferase